jgi:recombination protein RecT
MAAAAQKNDNANIDKPLVTFRHQLEQRLDSLTESLPPHITPGYYKGVIMRAVMADPGLLAADRVSLFEACLAAANDGLLPDKREGALVIYNTKIKENGKDIWIKKVTWMPMIRGILTKLYNTGLVKSATVGLVYEGDHFRAWTDDTGEHLEYEAGDKQNRDVVRRIFAQVVMKDGGTFVEEMWPADVEKIKAKSKSQDSGPWIDWWDEMAKKSVFRRLSKRLPMSREIMPILERDDALYDLNLKPAIAGQRQPMPSITHRLDALAGEIPRDERREKEPAGRQDDSDGQQKNKQSASTRKNAKSPDADSPSDPKPPAQDGEAPDSSDSPSGQESGATSPTAKDAYAAGQQARSKGMSRKAVPEEFREEPLLRDYLEGFDAAD